MFNYNLSSQLALLFKFIYKFFQVFIKIPKLTGANNMCWKRRKTNIKINNNSKPQTQYEDQKSGKINHIGSVVRVFSSIQYKICFSSM
jgi:hypothetical protein